ncbi:MAG: glycerate kinase [Phycisphaeraceae bacterium]|nr:glycerate kinase [Phycisphaeraceae bacterium]
MRIICAPDKFKLSISAEGAAQAMARGIRRVMQDAEVDCCPIADGGEGTVAAMIAATGGQWRKSTVTGPLGTPVTAAWGQLPDAAVIEMASAAGLALVPADQRDPMRTTTFGVGELIRDALDSGAQHILLGIGGSATNDGGIGMAQALGVMFFDLSGQRLTSPLTGGDLSRIARIDLSARDPRIAETRITVACDVTNPLTGPQGAAAIYGPQKGASPRQVEQLDNGLRHLARRWREDLGRDVETMPGAGAAGGLGGGLVTMLGASVQRGIDLVLEAVDFDRRVAGCDLCLTGEGQIDGQSLAGKACLGVAHRAAQAGTPTVALVGARGPQWERLLDHGLRDCLVIGEGLPVAESMRRAGELIESAAERVIRAGWPGISPAITERST